MSKPRLPRKLKKRMKKQDPNILIKLNFWLKYHKDTPNFSTF